MREWILLDPKSLNTQVKPANKSGVSVSVYLSPYDIPEAVRGYFDGDDSKCFVIEFKYMGGEEPMEAANNQQDITLMLGKKSGRLYRIILKPKEFPDGAVNLRLGLVEQAIGNLAKRPPRKPRVGNYKLAREVLSAKGAALFAGETCLAPA